MNLNLTDEEMAVIIKRLDKAIDITETKGLPEPLYWLCLARHGGQMTWIEDEGRKTKRREKNTWENWNGLRSFTRRGIHYGEINRFHSEGSPETLLAKDWSFCPNCGRSLK